MSSNETLLFLKCSYLLTQVVPINNHKADLRLQKLCSIQFIFADIFSVSHSGELKTLQPLDREEEDEYRFKMRAVDGGGRYCEADIHITVEDVNDNLPQFSSDPYTFTVFENTEIGTYVAKLQANDIDTGEFAIFL